MPMRTYFQFNFAFAKQQTSIVIYFLLSIENDIFISAFETSSEVIFLNVASRIYSPWYLEGHRSSL